MDMVKKYYDLIDIESINITDKKYIVIITIITITGLILVFIIYKIAIKPSHKKINIDYAAVVLSDINDFVSGKNNWKILNKDKK
jgi:hypothetical protein